jgi:predicted transcriptional regulator YdeE
LKKSWVFIAVIVLLVLIYTYLGGFSKPQFEVVQIDSVVITGYDFKGLLTEKEFGNLFRKTDSLIDHKVLDGKAVGVFYNQPSTKDDTVQVFVGVLNATKVPEGMTKKTFVLGKTLQASIKAHYMLLPVNIYPKIIEYAEEQKLKISPMSFEVYESSDLLKIWVPIVEGE